MILECLPTGMLNSNCYILGDAGEGAIVDAGVNEREIVDLVNKTGLKINYIILTHPHLDHIYFLDKIKSKTGAKVLIHKADAAALTDSNLNGSRLFGVDYAFEKADVLLKDGDVVNLGGLKLEIIHTPGHTPGGICIKAGNCIFTGDTLFKMSIGRTDLGNGNYEDIINSIREKLMKLDDDTIVYPGHGEATTIGCEKRHNPFINSLY
jgi:hydroxyacylglutathione hydrolase